MKQSLCCLLAGELGPCGPDLRHHLRWVFGVFAIRNRLGGLRLHAIVQPTSRPSGLRAPIWRFRSHAPASRPREQRIIAISPVRDAQSAGVSFVMRDAAWTARLCGYTPRVACEGGLRKLSVPNGPPGVLTRTEQMFYLTGKRHIGGEGRAHETGIPPTPWLRTPHSRSGAIHGVSTSPRRSVALPRDGALGITRSQPTFQESSAPFLWDRQR